VTTTTTSTTTLEPTDAAGPVPAAVELYYRNNDMTIAGLCKLGGACVVDFTPQEERCLAPTYLGTYVV
jgi:hypothetical protein